MKKTIILLSVLSLAGATQVYAEEASLDVSVQGQPVQVEMRGEVKAPRPDAKAIRANLQKEIDAKKAALKGIATSTRAEIKGDFEELKDLRKNASTTKAEFEAKRAEVKAEVELKREDLKEKRAEIKAEIKLTAAEKINQTVRNAVETLNRAISKLVNSKTAIESRLSKFEARGADTTLARTDLASASAKLDLAKSSVSVLATMNVSTSTKDSIKNFRTEVKKAQDSIQTAHQSLQKVIADMKGLEASVRATSTAEVR